MTSHARYQITFAWWNTSLAPSARSRSTSDQRDVACAVILQLIAIGKADFIALGEMSEDDLVYVSEKCGLLDYEFVSEISEAGRSKFDICYVFNKKKILMHAAKDIVSERSGETLKVAKKLEFFVADSDSLFHVYISHWPSRLWCSAYDPKRTLLGDRLRDQVEQIISAASENPFVVLLGDYNDEPFDESLSQILMASRDIELVRRRPTLLYNPFWKYLSRQQRESSMAGSYYYKSGKVTRWHTFDQIIFSHAFVEAKKWRLSEECDHILDFSDYTQMVKDTSSKFDHLPVCGTIEKVANDG